MEAILMNMCMIEDKDEKVLVQERIKGWPGIAFPGGKVEKFEETLELYFNENIIEILWKQVNDIWTTNIYK